MRHVVRFCVILLCYAALFIWPTFGARGAHRRVLGVVTQTDRGHLDSQNAVVGADIYSCDALDTNDGVALRARIGSSQVYLSAGSDAALEDDGSEIQVLITAGTVGFSEPATGEIAMRTPAGIIRAAGGGGAAGEVTFKGPKELVISAMRGALTLDNGGELRTIPEGKSADVTFDDNLEQGCHDEGADEQQQQRVYARKPIGFYIIVTTALAVPSYLLWREITESDSKPPK
jgi:hypothetical protein